MILYKNNFDVLPVGSAAFPASDLAVINALSATWAKLNPDDVWNTSDSRLVQSAGVDVNFLVANTDGGDQRIAFSVIVGDTGWNCTIVLATDAAAAIGVELKITPSRLSIIRRFTGAEIAALEIDGGLPYLAEINVTAHRHGRSVYLSVYDTTTEKFYAVTSERAALPLTFGTFVAVRGPASFDNLIVESMLPRVEIADGMLSLTNLRARVAEEIQDGGVSQATIDSHISRAYKEIYGAEKWRDRKMTTRLVLHEGVSEYVLPVGGRDVHSLRRSDGMLRYEGETYLETMYVAGVDGGKPTDISFCGRTVKILPTPSADWENKILVCEYYAGISFISATGFVTAGDLTLAGSFPNLPSVLHELIALRAAILLMEMLRESGQTPIFKIQEYARMYEKAKSEALGISMYPSQIRVCRR